MIGKLTGPVHVWEMFDKKRTFGEVTLPFCEAREYVMAVRYNALTGKGQQREIVESHLRKIKVAMETGEYTPTPASAALNKKHRERLFIADGLFRLEVNSDDPLLQTDAGHRFEALVRIADELEDKLAKATEAEEKGKLERWHNQVLNAPVTLTLYFDGDPARDFVNLQLGRPVDAAHMLSLKVQQKLLEDPSFKLAFETAKTLNKQEGSPFQNTIRFDSRGDASLPISTLCSKGSSDIGTSLVGLAKVGLSGEKDAAWLATAVLEAYKALQTNDRENDTEVGILEYGKVLTPLVNGGKKGQATMMVGVGICLAYRMLVLGNNHPTDDDLARLVAAAKQTLDVAVNGNFSGPTKRKLLGKFAAAFFADLTTLDRHGKLPVGLLKLLSASTFGAEPLPKEPKQKPVKTTKPQQEKAKGGKTKKKAVLPDVDGPVVTNEPIPVREEMPSGGPIAEREAVENEVDIPEREEDDAPWEETVAVGSDPWDAELDG